MINFRLLAATIFTNGQTNVQGWCGQNGLVRDERFA